MMTAVQDSNTWYCHAFCKIPKIQLVYPTAEDEINGKLEKELIEKSSVVKIITDPILMNEINQND